MLSLRNKTSQVGAALIALLATSCVASVTFAQEPRGHGPAAPASAFPSHVFRLAARAPEHPQLSFHYGLLQPIMMKGFNAAVDVRYKRLVVTFSHGQGLDFTDVPDVRSDAEEAAGVTVVAPYSTGFGAGLTLIDELYLLADLKFHKFQVRLDADMEEYKTVTLGLELGYRFFLWKGLHIAPVIRYWPTIHTSLDDDEVVLESSQGSVVHSAVEQGMAGGLFANLLIGWSFDL